MIKTLLSDLNRKRVAYKVFPEDQTFFRKYVKGNLELGSVAVMVFRFGHWVLSVKVPIIRQILLIIYWVLNVTVMVTTGINIQANSKIGRGFIIHNFSCIFILTDGMGENCTVNQGVTIGRIRGSKENPIIGDNVYFGSGCKVLGPVKIGNNVVIAANSLVITDVPDNCTVVGVPARIISRTATSEYLKS
jgi:serine O-acetyltransferase